VRRVEVDLADDRFDIAFDPKRASVEGMLRAIRKLDYQPAVVAAPTEKTVVVERIEASDMPADIRRLWSEALASNKPLLVEFSGPA
jgi:hypothetical protein